MLVVVTMMMVMMGEVGDMGWVVKQFTALCGPARAKARLPTTHAPSKTCERESVSGV